MAASKIGLSLWLGTVTILWSLYPLLFSHARGVLVLSLFTAILALAGWLTGLLLLVIWSGGLGLCNLTLALVLASVRPDLWAGLSAGLTLLALLDSGHRFTYVRRCWLAPGTVVVLLRPFVVISGLLLAVGLGLGALLIPLGQQPLAASMTGLVTLAGACMFTGFLALFLFYTSR